MGVATIALACCLLFHRLSFRGVLSEEELIMLEKAAATKAEVCSYRHHLVSYLSGGFIKTGYVTASEERHRIKEYQGWLID